MILMLHEDTALKGQKQAWDSLKHPRDLAKCHLKGLICHITPRGMVSFYEKK